MKLKIAGQQEKQEPVVELKLVQSIGGVRLQASVNEDHSYTLLEMYSDGSISRWAGVPKNLGFNLTADGRLKFDDEK